MTTGTDTDYSVDEIARAWLTKMRGEDAEALRAEFETWHAAAPEHGEAYQRISRKLNASALLKSSARHGLAKSQARRRPGATRWLPWGAVATAAAILLVAYGAGGAPLPSFLSSGASTAHATERLETRRGEIRTFRLQGGSVVTLDTDSGLLVTSSGSGQQVRLVRGRARVALPASAGAVRIHAGDRVMLTSDADLDLSLDADGRVRVALLRGAATFAPSNAAGGNGSPLPLGETLTYRDVGRPRPVTRATENMARDWPSGWAEYRKVTLAQLVAEANRYAIRPIHIDEPSLSNLEVSGRFKIDDTKAFTDRTARLFDLAVVEEPDGPHLRAR